MKLIIKLPVDENGKFKIQSRGNFSGRRYKTAIGLLKWIQGAFLRMKLEEKITIVVKEHIGTRFENVDETLPSNNKRYLIYVCTCFLEDYLSPAYLKKAEKIRVKHLDKGGKEA